MHAQLDQNLSVVVKLNNRIITDGPAIKAVLRRMHYRNPVWQMIWSVVLKALDCFPDFLLNILYKHIAKRRYRIFGQKRTDP